MESKITQGKVVFNNIDIHDFVGKENPAQMINNAFLEKEKRIRGTEEIIQENSNEQPSNNISSTPRVPKKKRRKIKKSVKIIFFFVIVIPLLIATFLNCKRNYIDNPKRIIKDSLEVLEKEITNLISMKEENILEKNNYSLECNLIANFENTMPIDLENKQLLDYYHILDNINHGKTTFLLQQDLSNKKLYFNQLTKIDDQVVIDDKYLIEDSTKYYFVKDFLDKYINAGNNNYFETISEDKTMYDNIQYLYSFILSSIFKNIEDKDISIKSVTTSLEEEQQKLKRITMELDNEKIKKIVTKVLKDLKEDKKAFNILNGIYNDFDSLKVPKEKMFLKEGETIAIHFYTKGIKNEIKVYEVLYHAETSYGIRLEIDQKKIELLLNNHPQYKIQYEHEQKENNLKGTIQNKNNIDIGKFEFKNQKKENEFFIHLKENEYDISLEIVSNQEEKKNIVEAAIKIQIQKKEDNIFQGSIDIEIVQQDKVWIQEQVKDIIFEKEITPSQKEELINLLKNRWKVERVF